MISVIITCYQKEEFLKECIDSVLFQSYKPNEIILVHDGCEKPLSYKEIDTIILGENRGIAYARDVGFRYSKGDRILFLDGDDKLNPDFIQKVSQINADIVYPDMLMFGVGVKLVKSDHRVIRKKMRIPISSLMKREVYQELGGFKDLPVYEDWDFWIRASEKFTFKKAETLLWYRQLKDSHVRSTSLKLKREIYEKITKLPAKSV